LSGLFCGNWNEILTDWESVNYYDAQVLACNGDATCISGLTKPENYEIIKTLINGGSYTSICGNSVIRFEGLKRLLVYYSYSRYNLINSFNDTPNGAVSKSNDFSIPKSGKELEAFSEKYRNMGFSIFGKIKGYISYAGLYGYENDTDCNCGHSKCKPATKNKGFGHSGRIIKKGY